MSTILIFGLKVALIGMSIVFIALVFLIFVIYAISAIIQILESKNTPLAGKKPEAAVNSNPAILTAADQDDTEVFAVIAAVIAAYSPNVTRVKTITRILGANTSAWSNAGRIETMILRQI